MIMFLMILIWLMHFYKKKTIGALQQVCVTRHDIYFVLNKLSQYMQSFYVCHWKVVTRILHYLKGTLSHSLLFKSTRTASIEVVLFHMMMLIGVVIRWIAGQSLNITFS